MARAPGLAAPTLSPFGGSGSGFGAFSIVDPGREAYLTFLKVENLWQNGGTTDTAYLAAMQVYAAALPVGSSTRINTEQRILETTYRVNRNVLVSKVNAGTKETSDLLAFDQTALTGLTVDSETYRDRLVTYQNTQKQAFSDDETAVVDRWQAGAITTAALQAWYREQAGPYASNPDLADAITKRITDLDQRVIEERDSATVTDYNAGRLSDDQFILYARGARARYVTGTVQAKEWDGRIETAQQARSENGLLYRYGLSQKYAELQRFVKSNSAAPTGGRAASTSTSTSKRIILGSDGQWHTVTSTSTRTNAGSGPTPLQQEAHRKLLIEIADAKKQMAEIVAQLGVAPDSGSWVSTESVIGYYQQRIASLTPGSADWYALQQKIDSLQERQHAETVFAKEGLRITYPGAGGSGGGAPTGPGGGGGGGTTGTSTSRPTSGGGGTTGRAPSASASVSIDTFMAALARVESGGRYDAVNKTSGAYGKYQIMPANWGAWAVAAGLPANAPKTPQNQELVAKTHMLRLFKIYGNWESVAYVWNTGTKPPASGTFNGYTTKVMAGLGITPAKPAAGATSAGGSTPSTRGAVGGLSELVSINRPLSKTGTANLTTRATGFPSNLDGQSFSNFYSAYERAFNAGQESFVDTSSGRPIAYFIGDDPMERIERMRQLDGLRIGYYQERAKAYVGTATEITAHNQLNAAVRDLAAHEYKVLDMAQGTYVKQADGSSKFVLSKGVGGVGYNHGINPLAAGNILLDKALENIALEVKAAQAAYDRGDFAAAYAHWGLANHYLDPSVVSSGPNKGQPLGTAVQLGKFLSATDQAIAQIARDFGGITPGEALPGSGGATSQFEKDLERLRNAQAEVAKVLDLGNDLDVALSQQVKQDASGRAILDNHGQVQLNEGWARFINEKTGKVTIAPIPVTGSDPSGRNVYSPKDQVLVTIKVGTTVEEAYAKWTASDSAAWVRRSDGSLIPMQGKIVTVMANGKMTTMYENPLNPGHWSSAPTVFDAPHGFDAVPAKGGGTSFQFTEPPISSIGADGKAHFGLASGLEANLTLSLLWDPATGSYTVVGNRPAGFMQDAIVDRPYSLGNPAILALLRSSGWNPSTPALGPDGFADVTSPTFGMTPDEQRQWAHRYDYSQPRTAFGTTGPTSISNAFAIRRAEAFKGVENLAAGRADAAAEDAARQALRGAAPAPITSKPASLPPIKLPQINSAVGPSSIAAAAARLPAPVVKPTLTSTVTKTAIATATKATAPAPVPVVKPQPAPIPAPTTVTSGRYTGKILPGG